LQPLLTCTRQISNRVLVALKHKPCQLRLAWENALQRSIFGALQDIEVILLGVVFQKYAAPNGTRIRISSGGETKKIRVLVGDLKTSLAKSPNAR
jgi:hypothetical protein